LYFSRANIPYARDAQESMSEQSWAEFAKNHNIRRHVGLYAFRVRGLRRFVELGPSTLEQIEMLEQLRWLQAGLDLLVVDAFERVPGGVDTLADLERVQALWPGKDQ
jgi:3-deoxy-manno-octulosonate cytidylyltransferase (CMP-KDO synthetase)